VDNTAILVCVVVMTWCIECIVNIIMYMFGVVFWWLLSL